MPSLWRKALFGSPLATHQVHHQKLPKYVALPVFASDAISSVAYATEEILLALTLGTGVAAAVALQQVFPISAAIAVLLAIVVFSYRQTIHAYPNGGGSYIVAKDNLGTYPGLTAGASLLIDYVLTVAVSIAAGVAAIVSAFPALEGHRVGLCLAFIALLTLANLRGLKESGFAFMFPTYAFLFCIYSLMAVGFFKYFTGALGHNPALAEHAAAAGPATQGLTLFLILRAFSSGCVAMTGTEAVSNGVPAFRPPEPRNASATLIIMASILGSLFLGGSFLAWQYGAVPDHNSETVMSILASGVFGRDMGTVGGWFYYGVQFTTCLLLIVAANTAYADFPRLTMLMARDGFLPRQFANVGDRLVFSNGIIILAVLAGLLIMAFGGVTHHLIPLYSVGVFLSFTLSQSGMVRRWFRLRSPGWQRNAAINGFGALATLVVLLVIAYTKFASGDPISVPYLTTPLTYWAVATAAGFLLVSMYHRWMGKWLLGLSVASLVIWGVVARPDLLQLVSLRMGAWIVLVVIPTLIWMCSRIRDHYEALAEDLTMTGYRPLPEFRNTVLVIVGGLHRGIMPAIQYARSLGGDVRGVYVEIEPEKTKEVQQRWVKYVQDVPLVVLDSPYRALTEPIIRYVDDVERERDDDVVTVIIPEFVPDRWWTSLLHGQSGLMLKWALLFKKGVVVSNVRYHVGDAGADELGTHPLVRAREER
jgi:amino acid transporter